MNLDNMHSTTAENARKCAQKLIGHKWTKYLFSYSISCFFCCICVLLVFVENIVVKEFVEHLTNCIGVTAPLLERRKTVE